MGLDGKVAAEADRAADDNSGFEADVGIDLPSGFESAFESVFGRDAVLT